MNGSLIDSYIEDIAKRIHDPALHGAASVMVGAGFSKNADVVDDELSAPNWEELAVSMFEALYQKPKDEAEINNWQIQKIKKTSGKNVLKLAEEYKSVFGRNKLNKFIELNINDDMYIPGDIHKKLLSLNWRDVFTTNYDTLLERTIDKINVKFNYQILTSQNDLPGSTHPRIIKLHGSVDRAKHYIICEEDYRTYPIQFAPLVNTVQQAMLETQLCLIGFSGDDPNFLSWLGWLRDNMGENCPTIYLVGLFENMSVAEKMTLENQNITVINLGDMFEEKVNHQEALTKFLDKLTNYGKEKSNIFEESPYKPQLYDSDFYKMTNDTYFSTMDEYLTRMRGKINGYLTFPNNAEAKEFINSLQKNLGAILKLDPSKGQINLLSKLVYFLRRGYLTLDDYNAERIQLLLDTISEVKLQNEKTLLLSWSEVTLYLLEMYRIDGRYEEYKSLLARVEHAILELNGYTKEEIQIEKCKFLIANFDFEQATKEVEKIKHQTAIDIQLKKVFLYKQIDEDEKGLDLLRQTSAIVSQKKYSENKTASLRGYLNLGSRTLINGFIRNDDESFSDKEYSGNPYNVRNIYNQIKNEVSNSLLLANNEARGETPGFNPGTYKITYGTVTKNEENAIRNSLKYILFQDLLCLPNTFADHIEILTLAIKEIIDTSRIPTWKWSAIIRTNHSKVINSFFTRERIISAQSIWVEELFDQLFKLSDEFTLTGSGINQRKIISQKTIFDMLTRFSIVLDDERVIQLIKKMIEVRKNVDEFGVRYFKEFFTRLRPSLNSKIFAHCFDVLLESNSIPSEFLLTFVDVEVIMDPPEISDDSFKKIIKELKSKVEEVRNRGIAKIVLVDTFSDFGKYEDEIAQAIWGQTDKRGFPTGSFIHLWVWEDLPHPTDIHFIDLYKDYLKNPKFKRSVNGGMITSSSDSDNIINEYVYLFRHVSIFSQKRNRHIELSWQAEDIQSILADIYGYIDNEKSLIEDRMNLFGMAEEAKKRFTLLGDLVAMILAQALYSKLYTDDVKIAADKVKELLNKIGISTMTLELIDNIIANNSIELDIKHLMNQVMVGKKDELRQVMTAIDILLMLEFNSMHNITVSRHLVELINALKYFEAERSTSVMYHLTYVIDHPLLTEETYRDIIIDAFGENLAKLDLSLNETNRELIESIHSLSILIRRYYDSLIVRGIPISEQLTHIIDELLRSRLKEVRYMWEDCSR